MQKYTSLPFINFETGDTVLRCGKPDIVKWVAVHCGNFGENTILVATENQSFYTTLEDISLPTTGA